MGLPQTRLQAVHISCVTLEPRGVLLACSRGGDGGHVPRFFRARSSSRGASSLQGPETEALSPGLLSLTCITNSRKSVRLGSSHVLTSARQWRVSSDERDTICRCFRGRVMWSAPNLQQVLKIVFLPLHTRSTQAWRGLLGPGPPRGSVCPCTHSHPVGASPPLPWRPQEEK